MRILAIVLIASLAYLFSVLWQRRRDRAIEAARLAAWGPFDPDRHKEALDRAVAVLEGAFGADTFSAPDLEGCLPVAPDRAEYFRQAVALAADRFQVTLPTIDLRFAPTRGEGASAFADWNGGHRVAEYADKQLRLHYASDDHGTWRIRIDPAFRNNDAAVMILAAHELTHFILRREGLDYTDELLVDTAVVLLGYGPLMARFRTTRQPIRAPNGRRQWTVVGPGYLHPQAIDHLIARRALLRAS